MIPKLITLLTILIPSIDTSDRFILIAIWLIRCVIDYDVLRPGHSGNIYKLTKKVEFETGELIVALVQFIPANIFLITTVFMKAWIPFLPGVIATLVYLFILISSIKDVIFLKGKEVDNNKNLISVYSAIRYAATGVFGYEFVDENNVVVCQNSSAPIPDAALMLNGFGYRMSSQLCALDANSYQTIDDSEGRTIAYIQYKDPNKYLLNFHNMEIEIKRDETSYNFYVDKSLIVSIIKNKQPYIENGFYYDKEKMFDIKVWTELEPVVLLVVLNIPSLIV